MNVKNDEQVMDAIEDQMMQQFYLNNKATLIGIKEHFIPKRAEFCCKEGFHGCEKNWWPWFYFYS